MAAPYPRATQDVSRRKVTLEPHPSHPWGRFAIDGESNCEETKAPGRWNDKKMRDRKMVRERTVSAPRTLKALAIPHVRKLASNFEM